MVNLTIDHIPVTVPEGTTILDAARSAGIHIPSLCYLRGVNEIGACRVCVVELVGMDRLVPACNNVVEEGMEVLTSSPKVRETRRISVELLLSQHDCHCATCVRSGNCSLQTIANDLNILDLPFEKKVPETRWDRSFPLFRDASKCIKCMRCIQICDKVQTLSLIHISLLNECSSQDIQDGLKKELETWSAQVEGVTFTDVSIEVYQDPLLMWSNGNKRQYRNITANIQLFYDPTSVDGEEKQVMEPLLEEAQQIVRQSPYSLKLNSAWLAFTDQDTCLLYTSAVQRL